VATRQLLFAPLQHGSPVFGGVFTPDGRRIVTASGAVHAQVWNADTGGPIGPPLRRFGFLKPTDLSPDGRLIITLLKDDGVVRIWDFASCEAPTLEVTPVDRPPSAFSRDGRFKVTLGEENSARVMEVKTSRPMTQPLKHAAPLRQAVFSPDASLLVSETMDSELRIWDSATGEALGPALKADYVPGTHDAGAHVATARLPTKRELAHDDRPTGDLAQLAELLSGYRIDDRGGFLPLEAQEVTDRWTTLRRGYPTNFTTTPEEIGAWHDKEANACESDWNWWAARFHLDRLLEAKPGDPTLQARRDYAQLALDRENEINATNRVKIRPIPPRPTLATAGMVDLSRHFNKSLKADFKEPAPGVSATPVDLPCRLQPLPGVEFDVRGIIQLGSRQVPDRPMMVEGIEVGRKCERLHFLHATRYSDRDLPPVEVGSYVLHYADGQEKSLPIVYGQDIRNCCTVQGEPLEAQKAVLAWLGTSPEVQANSAFLRLFMSTWSNPRPGQEVISLDFRSSVTNDAAPFLIAVTVE
jgi:WD40 repeat protein